MALSDRDRAILDLERTWWTEPGPKELAIRERFDLSPTRYYQVLNELPESAEAVAYDPLGPDITTATWRFFEDHPMGRDCHDQADAG